ncbi:MAG: hypothetical protein HOV86_30280 [Thermoactinospora sp.]|nr:hypothetical protein [Thermoactinospora sp.]
MKRIVAGIILTLALAATPSHAAAATHPAVKALKAEFRPDHGVKFTESHRYSRTLGKGAIRVRGVVGFDKRGFAAHDLTSRERGWRGVETYREIFVDGLQYLSGDRLSSWAEEGKTWSVSGMPTDAFAEQLINVLDPRVLSWLLKTASTKTAREYRGSFLYGELRKVEGGTYFKPWEKAKFTFRLQLDKRHRIVRIVTSTEIKGNTNTTDTRLSGWGSKVEITAPPAEEVHDTRL